MHSDISLTVAGAAAEKVDDVHVVSDGAHDLQLLHQVVMLPLGGIL